MFQNVDTWLIFVYYSKLKEHWWITTVAFARSTITDIFYPFWEYTCPYKNAGNGCWYKFRQYLWVPTTSLSTVKKMFIKISIWGKYTLNVNPEQKRKSISQKYLSGFINNLTDLYLCKLLCSVRRSKIVTTLGDSASKKSK